MKNLVVVGLGNPGTDLEHTYHNVGRLALERMADGEFRMEGKKKPELKKHKNLFEYASGDGIIFVQPLVFMNESGIAVREALKKFGAKPEELLVLHDDSDITIGDFKISFGKNSAGHKGVQSIIDHLDTNQFARVRIGIRPPREARRKKAGEFALKTITPSHRKILDQVFKKIEEQPKEGYKLSPVIIGERHRKGIS